MPDGKQYVQMDVKGEVVPVFGDWETYGNPVMDNNRERIIADEDFIIYSLGDGTYALDVEAMEDKMVNPEQYDRGDREAMMASGLKGGPGESRMGDLMEMLNSMRGQGGAPAPANRGMRPMRR